MTEPKLRCPACRSASLVTERERLHNLCAACEQKVPPGPTVPRLRPPIPCARCGHTQLVRGVVYDRDDLLTLPAGIGHGYEVHQSFTGKVQAMSVKHRGGHGAFVAYVCRGCGYTELYTAGFAQIPIGPQYGTELVDVAPEGPDGPFR